MFKPGKEELKLHNEVSKWLVFDSETEMFRLKKDAPGEIVNSYEILKEKYGYKKYAECVKVFL
jgi:hypothetical protein